MKTSNKFTLVRLLFAPVFFVLYFLPVWTGNAALAKISVFVMIPCLIFAELTDALDGHFARKHNEVSDFGKLFDPFADVMLHLTSFLCFLFPGFGCGEKGYMPLFLFLMLFYREFCMNFIRMVCAKKGLAIGAKMGGKIKTVFYVVAEFYTLIVECLLRLEVPIYDCFSTLQTVAIVFFAICVALSYVSFIDYIVTFKKVLKNDNSEN